MAARENRSVGIDPATTGFEEIYARAGTDFSAIPWARLAPNPALPAYLEQRPIDTGGQALVVGCGLGDDAEELCRRGYRVTAFDLSATAIGLCHRRFPQSGVNYRVEDLFGLPVEWRRRFDFVVEIHTLQSLPAAQRPAAIAAIAATVRPGGQVFVRCLARDDDEPAISRPWPLRRTELRAFTDAGLREVDVLDEISGPGGHRVYRAIFARPSPEAGHDRRP